MRDLFDRLRFPILFGLIVVVTLTTMVADRRAARGGGRDHGLLAGLVLDVAAPVQKMMATPADLARELWGRYVALLAVRSENDRLRERIARLEEENLQFREALVASGHLRRIAEMRSELETPMLPAQVVGQDASAWFRSVLLDRGRSHGVGSGMPVVTNRGLAGLVTATSPRASKAMLLTDQQSSVDGIVQRSRAQGIVRGRRGGRLEFEFVVRGTDVHVGDVVITSGLGGVHPNGLRIGEVVEVGEPGDLLQTAVLRPAVDFGRLEGVFVMLWRAPTMDLLYGDEELAQRAEP
jgi:rod shape-determining protein MreC